MIGGMVGAIGISLVTIGQSKAGDNSMIGDNQWLIVGERIKAIGIGLMNIL